MDHHITAWISYRTSHNFFGGRTFLSVQIKRVCNTTALSRISVDLSPSFSVEVFELIVNFHVLGHSFRHTRHRLIYSCGVSVEEFRCQEKLRTADEISRRIMNGAVIARRDQRKRKLAKTTKYVRIWSQWNTYAVPLLRFFFHDQSLSALPWASMLITGTAIYRSAKLFAAAVPTVIDLHPAAAQNRPYQARGYAGVRGWQH